MFSRIKKLSLFDTGISILAFLPLGALLFIVVQLIVESVPIVKLVGFSSIFSTQISTASGSTQGIPTYGMLPGIWGTLLIIIVSMGIAVPVSLAIAIFSTEFTVGKISKIMPAVLNVLGGIPPIIYGMIAFFIAQIFIIPKFCGAGIPLDQMPVPVSDLPYYRSTLLGGIMLSLLIVPFLSPLFYDAICDVPSSIKEASIGLGVSRWRTLTGATLPYAFWGLVSATTLGTLKAMGDVIIVGMTCGFTSGLPTPIFDIFEPVTPLTSTGAGYIGGFSPTARTITANSAANFAGLLLLVVAFILLFIVYFLQKKFKQRYAK